MLLFPISKSTREYISPLIVPALITVFLFLAPFTRIALSIELIVKRKIISKGYLLIEARETAKDKEIITDSSRLVKRSIRSIDSNEKGIK